MTVLKRSDRKRKPYFFKFQFRGETIRRYFQTKGEAEVEEARERVKLEELLSPDTFLALAEKRLAVIEAYSTPLWFRNCVGIIDRGFYDWYLLRASDITTEMVRNRVIEIGKRQSNSIANRSLIVVKAVFAQAVKDGALVRNPAFGVAPLPTEKARKLIPKREDIDKVMELAGPLERAYLETILFTGARVGEINGLTWADVDFERRTLKLWTRKKKGGNRKYRTVHMVERVYAALQLVREWLGPLITPWVFNNLEMTKRHPFDVNKWRYIYRDKFLKTLCRKAGVLEFTYHHLRHYTASALAEAGVPLTTIQQILGHESAVTTNNYLQDLGRADTALEVL